MPANEVHVGDTGTVITITLYDGTTLVDLTSYATTRKFYFVKPDGTQANVTATAATPANGQLTYTSLVGTFDQEGVYQLQAEVASAFVSWRSDIQTFTVYAAI